MDSHLMKNKFTDVDSYIKNAPEWAQETLIALRKAIIESAPEAIESISYHMPYYSQNGRLAYFGAYKNHCSFHWISSEDKKIFAQELAKQKVVGSTLQIPRGEKVPSGLIKKIVTLRLKNNERK